MRAPRTCRTKSDPPTMPLVPSRPWGRRFRMGITSPRPTDREHDLSGVLLCQSRGLEPLMHLLGRQQLLVAAALANEHVLVAGLVAVHVSHDPAREVPPAHTRLSTHACACRMRFGMPGTSVHRSPTSWHAAMSAPRCCVPAAKRQCPSGSCGRSASPPGPTPWMSLGHPRLDHPEVSVDIRSEPSPTAVISDP